MRNCIILCFLSLVPFLSSTTLSAQEVGKASFYSDDYHGRKTASGEAYDKTLLTAAHKSLPFGTIIRVTRLDNKASVKVRINDRGPYIKGRIVDLSRKAAEEIAMIRDGEVRVRLDILGESNQTPKPEARVSSTAPTTTTPSTPPVTTTKPQTVETKKPKPDEYAEKSNQQPKTKIVENIEAGIKNNKKPTPTPPKKETVAPPKAKPVPTVAEPKRVRGKDFKTYDLYKVQIMRPEKAGYGVQVSSLTNYENVMKQMAELQERWFNNILLNIEEKDGKPLYKIILGPFPDRDTAKSYQKDLMKKKKINGFIIDLSTVN